MHCNGWSYAVSTSETYPERHAYGLLNTLKSEVEKGSAEDTKFIKTIQKKVEENAVKYEDLTKIDKVRKAQA